MYICIEKGLKTQTSNSHTGFHQKDGIMDGFYFLLYDFLYVPTFQQCVAFIARETISRPHF